MKSMTICHNKNKLIGFNSKSSDWNAQESVKQLLYTFPAMFSKVLTTDPSHFESDSFHACIIYGEKDIMFIYVTPSIEKGHVNVKKIAKTFKYTREDMIKCLITICFHSETNLQGKNIYKEALKLGKLKSIKNFTMDQLYQLLLTKKQKTKAPKPCLTPIQKQQIKERTCSILKDITNIQRLPPNIVNTKQKQQFEKPLQVNHK